MLSGSLETRTIERVNFMACLSFVFGENICQLCWRDIAIHIIVDQNHWSHATSAQAAHGFQCEAAFGVGFASFQVQCLLESLPQFPSALYMARSGFAELHHVSPGLFGGQHVLEGSQSVH